MANKALAKRQKMAIRSEPKRVGSKPKNPYAVAAKQRAAGVHRVTASGQRQQQKRVLTKVLDDPAGNKD